MNKSKKLRLAAKLISCIGIVACLIGCALYSVFTLPDVLNLPFEWTYIIVDAVCIVVFIAIAIILNLVANSVQRKAEIEAARLEAERLEALAAAEAAAAAAAAEAEAEAAALAAVELEETKTEIKYPEFIEKLYEKLPEEARDMVDKAAVVVDKAVVAVKDNAKVVVPAAGACVAALVLKKVAKARRHAKNRKKFYKWLG